MKRTLLSIFMAVFLLSVSAFAMSFSHDEIYSMQQPLSDFPSTLEAVVLYPESFDTNSRGGVIIGNYDGGRPCINLEIYSGGAVRVYVTDKDKTVYNAVFTKTNVYNGKKTHIAVTIDSANSKVHCYIDGSLAETLAISIPNDIVLETPLILGGDRREGNGQYCKGQVFSLAMYGDVRSEDEILSDFSSERFDTDGAICCYKLTSSGNGSVIEDLSGNGNDFKGTSSWLDEVEIPDDFSYSFAIVGDTQIVNRYQPQYMTSIYDWLADNAHSNKLKVVMGLGDITDTDTDGEWALAKAVMQKLDAVVPYSIVRGNHDSLSKFNKYFPKSQYSDTVSGTYDNSMVNSYRFITVNGIKYLIFTLDYGASDSVLNWAGNIISDNPDSNVIITTHAYLYRDGTTLDVNDVCPPSVSGGSNNGDDIWDKLISKHENIVLVVSGHDPCDNVVLAQDEGENGNIVSQLLVDPQGTDASLRTAGTVTGMVAMLYFSEDGSHVDVRYYSTVRNKYYLPENQFSFDINVIEADTAVPSEPEMEIGGICFDVTLTADELDGKIVAALYDDFGVLASVKIYDAEDVVSVSFPENVSGSEVKVFWWNGTDTLIPLSVNEKLSILS